MKIELSNEEIHALIEWHDDWSQIDSTWDADLVADAARHRRRGDELWFLVTGSRRKPAGNPFSEPK